MSSPLTARVLRDHGELPATGNPLFINLCHQTPQGAFVSQTITITTDELIDLLEEIESLTGMLESYYAQSDVPDKAAKLVERFRLRLPFHEPPGTNASCPDCPATFCGSDRRRNIDRLVSHGINKHGWSLNRRKNMRKRLEADIGTLWPTKQAYLESLAAAEESTESEDVAA